MSSINKNAKNPLCVPPPLIMYYINIHIHASESRDE